MVLSIFCKALVKAAAKYEQKSRKMFHKLSSLNLLVSHKNEVPRNSGFFVARKTIYHIRGGRTRNGVRGCAMYRELKPYQIERLKEQYPPGTRIELHFMPDDPRPIKGYDVFGVSVPIGCHFIVECIRIDISTFAERN